MNERILFCNIAYMKYYDVDIIEDVPKHGGRYVSETGDALEKYNFHVEEDGKVYGFVETKYRDSYKTSANPNQIHIERIDPALKNENSISNVTVVFCAKLDLIGKSVIIGWYKNATVLRKRDNCENRKYNIFCNAENAFILPEAERRYEVPRAGKEGLGFGQSNISVKDAEQAVGLEVENKPADEYEDYYINWLSPEEYKKLTPAERNQRSLDRYKNRKKTSWDAGIEYERFVGYWLEGKGFNVKYNGATKGLEDYGVDLIASKGNEVLVIQCKRWIKEITIHEKTILYLYGSKELLQINDKAKKYTGVIISSTKLTDEARKCADILGIRYFENKALEEYPLIKCNVSKKDKIYHLPFDQQYDKINNAGKANCMYVKTVEEAEKMGYRHAYRWKGSNAN